MTTNPTEHRAELEKLSKTELAEMYRSTLRLPVRPSLRTVMREWTKARLVDRLVWLGGQGRG